MRVLTNHSSRAKYVDELKVFNSRLDLIKVDVLGVKFKCLGDWSPRRRADAQAYLQELRDLDLIFSVVPHWADPVWYLFEVRITSRDELQSRLNQAGISTLFHNPTPPHMQQAVRGIRFIVNQFTVVEQITKELLSMPMDPALKYEQVVETFSDCLQ